MSTIVPYHSHLSYQTQYLQQFSLPPMSPPPYHSAHNKFSTAYIFSPPPPLSLCAPITSGTPTLSPRPAVSNTQPHYTMPLFPPTCAHLPLQPAACQSRTRPLTTVGTQPPPRHAPQSRVPTLPSKAHRPCTPAKTTSPLVKPSRPAPHLAQNTRRHMSHPASPAPLPRDAVYHAFPPS